MFWTQSHSALHRAPALCQFFFFVYATMFVCRRALGVGAEMRSACATQSHAHHSVGTKGRTFVS